jgi:DNA-binding MarR family transcriptional regulator
MNALHLSNQLCFPFYSISKEITKRYRLLLEPLHLTYPQYLVMLVMWEQDQIPMKAIGTRLKLDSGTLTPLINKLITLGYIEKSRNPDDERHLVIQLTAKGLALEFEAQHIPEKIVEILGISEEEYVRYQQMLAEFSMKLGLNEDSRC